MKLLRYLFGERGTLFGLGHSGSLNLMRFLYCLVTAVTMVGYAAEYDRRYLSAPYYASPLFEWFGDPIPFALYQTLRWVCVGALVLAALGVFTRPSLLVAALSFFVYEGTQLGFTKPPDSDYSFHITNHTVYFLLILMVAPSVDRHTIFTTWKGRNEPTLIPEWPRKAMIAIIALAYFGAGYCRVLASPLWVDGHTLQGYLMDKSIRWDIAIGWEVAQHWLPCVILSVMTMALELGYPIVLFFPRWKPILIVSGLMMHVGIFLGMNINFFFFFAYSYFAFLEWPWLVRVFGRAKQGVATIVSKAPAPSPIPRAWLAGFILFVGVQAGAVFFRVEAWPFSDFRVFSKRTKPEEITSLYLALPGRSDAPPEYVPFWEQYYMQRAIGWRPQNELVEAENGTAEEKRKHLAEIEYQVRKALARDFKDLWQRYPDGLRLFQKRPRFDEASGRYRVSTEFVLDLVSPKVSKAMSTGVGG